MKLECNWSHKHHYKATMCSVFMKVLSPHACDDELVRGVDLLRQLTTSCWYGNIHLGLKSFTGFLSIIQHFCIYRRFFFSKDILTSYMPSEYQSIYQLGDRTATEFPLNFTLEKIKFIKLNLKYIINIKMLCDMLIFLYFEERKSII